MAIIFSQSTLNKEGILQDGKVTYNINVTAVNNGLTRLHCSITKNIEVQHPDGNGGQTTVEEPQHIGHITLEYGRQVTELPQGEDLLPHLIKFNEILDEVLGKKEETKTLKK